MLDVSLNLAAVVAMLLGIVVPGLHIEVDSLNGPTVKPFPDGSVPDVITLHVFQEQHWTDS